MLPYVEIAERFGNLTAKSDYEAACSLLTEEAQSVHTPEQLREAVQRMTAYSPGPILEVEVLEEFMLEDWPAKRDGDVAWIYVSLMGAEFVEAVTVVVVQDGDNLRIREIEWGRP